MLVTNELYDSSMRLVQDEITATEMTGVEHLGQYVFDMTKAKIEASNVMGPPLQDTASEYIITKGDDEEEEEEGRYKDTEEAEAEAAADVEDEIDQ